MKRRNKALAIVMALVMVMGCTPTVAFAYDDICYDNPIEFDEWDNPTDYGSHDWYYYDSEEPTCDTEGWIEYECSYCYESHYESVHATGHHWSKPSLVDSPSRYDTLIWGQECLNGDCEKTKYAPIKVKKGKKKRLISKKHLKKIRKLSNRKIKWSSSKKKVASVKNGVVKAKKKGTTYIKAKVYVKKYRTWIYLKYKVVVK